jgi:hypothetical protein
VYGTFFRRGIRRHEDVGLRVPGSGVSTEHTSPAGGDYLARDEKTGARRRSEIYWYIEMK